MTQEFKFGDKCYHLTGGVEVIIVSEEPVITDDGSKMWQIFDETFGYHLCGDDKLELIPHPDTVRLDWLAKNNCTLTEKLCDEDGDMLDVPFGVIQIEEQHFEVLAAASDIRQAIDAAMQHETNHE